MGKNIFVFRVSALLEHEVAYPVRITRVVFISGARKH
jgi:hypothetical protein